MPTRPTFISRRGALALGGGALLSAPALAQMKPLGGGTVPSNIVLCGTSLTLAPFSFINEKGDSVGFELDILAAVGQKLGFEVRYVRVPFSQNFTSLNAGIFRISAASAFMTCAQAERSTGRRRVHGADVLVRPVDLDPARPRAQDQVDEGPGGPQGRDRVDRLDGGPAGRIHAEDREV